MSPWARTQVTEKGRGSSGGHDRGWSRPTRDRDHWKMTTTELAHQLASNRMAYQFCQWQTGKPLWLGRRRSAGSWRHVSSRTAVATFLQPKRYASYIYITITCIYNYPTQMRTRRTACEPRGSQLSSEIESNGLASSQRRPWIILDYVMWYWLLRTWWATSEPHRGHTEALSWECRKLGQNAPTSSPNFSFWNIFNTMYA